jgi:cell division septation protein DedD
MDGEKELVLGNKQLVSLFFVVVALCGIFFGLGYMIGHNTSKASLAGGDTGSVPATAAAASEVPQSAESEPPREIADTPPSTTASTVPADVSPTPVPVSTNPETSPSRAPAIAAKTAPEKTSVPQPGATYLQVTALRRVDADKLVKTLKEQNFPAVIAESSKPDLFRVLVGPYHQTSDVADAKSRLKSLGFANVFLQK